MELLVNPSCNTSTLTAYVDSQGNSWNTTKIKHAYRRLGFGATISQIDDALNISPSQFIDNLVDEAVAMPTTAAPPWANWSFSDYTDFDTENDLYVETWRLQSGNDINSTGLRGRLSSFWMNHFVTELETVYYAPYMFQYYNKMQTFALGNFKDFARAIGKDNMMLLYLNGFENTNINPNENYARELFELFTLGEGDDYTQDDIINASRALTGYNHWDDFGASIYFDVSTHDSGVKTIFGQEGNWGYDDLIDILFDQRSTVIANYICEKLYNYFVSPTVDETIRTEIIAPLAQTLIGNNWEMIPMFKQLFKSEHFFDERALGVIVKSPFDVIFSFVNDGNFFYDDSVMEAFIYFASLVGQKLYNPPDVSGWQRDESWINGSTLSGRWGLMEYYIYFIYDANEFAFVDFFKDLSNDSNDPAFITQVVIDHLAPKSLHTATDYDIATDIFKWDVPQNYYDDGIWNLDWGSAPYQCILLLIHLVRMPEFQLK